MLVFMRGFTAVAAARANRRAKGEKDVDVMLLKAVQNNSIVLYCIVFCVIP